MGTIVVFMFPPQPVGRGGTSRFTVVSRHPNLSRRLHPSASIRVRPHLCQTLFMRYFLQVFDDDFKILRFGDHGKDLELNFS